MFQRQDEPAGTIIYHQGNNDPDEHSFYVIEEGECEIIVDGISIATVTDFFGELSLLYNEPRAATIRTLTPCKLWYLERYSFEHAIATRLQDDLNATEDFLAKVPLLKGLNEQQLSALAGTMQPISCQKGQRIVEKGTPGNFLFLIRSGKVRCTDLSDGTYLVDDDDGVLRLGKGEFFGERAFFLPGDNVRADAWLRPECVDRMFSEEGEDEGEAGMGLLNFMFDGALKQQQEQQEKRQLREQEKRHQLMHRSKNEQEQGQEGERCNEEEGEEEGEEAGEEDEEGGGSRRPSQRRPSLQTVGDGMEIDPSAPERAEEEEVTEEEEITEELEKQRHNLRAQSDTALEERGLAALSRSERDKRLVSLTIDASPLKSGDTPRMGNSLPSIDRIGNTLPSIDRQPRSQRSLSDQSSSHRSASDSSTHRSTSDSSTRSRTLTSSTQSSSLDDNSSRRQKFRERRGSILQPFLSSTQRSCNVYADTDGVELLKVDNETLQQLVEAMSNKKQVPPPPELTNMEVLQAMAVFRHGNGVAQCKGGDTYEDMEDDVEQVEEVEEANLTRLVEAMEERAYSKGEVIVDQFKVATTFFILKAGKVGVSFSGTAPSWRDRVEDRKSRSRSVGDSSSSSSSRSRSTTVGDSSSKRPAAWVTSPKEWHIGTLSGLDHFGAMYEEFSGENVVATTDVTCLTLDLKVHSELLKPFRTNLVRAEVSRGVEKSTHLYHDVTFDDVETIGFLGTGKYSTVRLVRHTVTKVTMALKIMSKAKLIAMGSRAGKIILEKDMLEQMVKDEDNGHSVNRHAGGHPFVMQLIATAQDPLQLFLFTEVCMGGELFSYLHESTTRGGDAIPFEEARFYTACLVEALEHIHSRGIVYRDLKPENVLLDQDGYCKIIDFGFARRTNDSERLFSICGTMEYLAPEVLLRKGYGQGCDHWALGILLFEMVMGETPWAGEGSELEQVRAICHDNALEAVGAIGVLEDEDCEDLILALCQRDPHKRLGASGIFGGGGARDIKDHVWFEGWEDQEDEIDWVELLAKGIEAPWLPTLLDPTDRSHFPELDDKVVMQSNDEFSVEASSTREQLMLSLVHGEAQGEKQGGVQPLISLQSAVHQTREEEVSISIGGGR
jgi:serine/threonine protein kinase/CRP-like cAMP-binding protein